MKDLFLTIIKFVLAVFLLPVVMGVTYAFQLEVMGLEEAVRQTLLAGTVSYVIMRFFVYDFSAIYVFGQTITSTCVRFSKPLVNVLPYLLPIYTILIMAVYGIMSKIGKLGGEWTDVCLFLMAFTFCMHLVMSAQDLYDKDSSAGKPDYFLGMSLIYIIDIFLVAIFMYMCVANFSFNRFFLATSATSFDIYGAVFHQLF